MNELTCQTTVFLAYRLVCEIVRAALPGYFKRKLSFREALLVSTILLIDDDVQLAAAITDLFKLNGHAVIIAHNGRQGLDRLQRGAQPSLILLDLVMPEMDGWEFLRQKSAAPAIADIPTVVMSGSI